MDTYAAGIVELVMEKWTRPILISSIFEMKPKNLGIIVAISDRAMGPFQICGHKLKGKNNNKNFCVIYETMQMLFKSRSIILYQQPLIYVCLNILNVLGFRKAILQKYLILCNTIRGVCSSTPKSILFTFL